MPEFDLDDALSECFMDEPSKWEKVAAVLISPRLWIIWFFGHFHRRAP